MPLYTKNSIMDAPAKSYRVVLFCTDQGYIDALTASCDQAGYTRLACLSDYTELVRVVSKQRPDVLLVASTFVHTRFYDVMTQIQDLRPLPVVMFTSKQSDEQTRTLLKAGVSSLVMNGSESNRLASIVAVAVARFEQQESVRLELKLAQKRLSDRKLVERAKGLIMEHKGLSEDKAYRSLRELSMNKGIPLSQVAETVIEVMSVAK